MAHPTTATAWQQNRWATACTACWKCPGGLSGTAHTRGHTEKHRLVQSALDTRVITWTAPLVPRATSLTTGSCSVPEGPSPAATHLSPSLGDQMRRPGRPTCIRGHTAPRVHGADWGCRHERGCSVHHTHRSLTSCSASTTRSSANCTARMTTSCMPSALAPRTLSAGELAMCRRYSPTRWFAAAHTN